MNATAEARRVMRRHDENFPLLFPFLRRDERRDMAVIYAFCRSTDDVGDDAPGDRLALLDRLERDVLAAFDDRAPVAEGLGPLRATVRRRGLGPEPFLRLIEANRIDQRQNRWQSHEELLWYCRHSAEPVGHMVLGVLGCDDPERRRLSDATCTGLQLVNFWQDIRRDLVERDRIYLPQADMDRFGVTEADLGAPTAGPATRELVRFQVDRARACFARGGGLARLVPRRAALDVALFTAAGRALCDAIERQGYDTLAARPAPGKLGRAALVARALLGGGR